MNQLHSKTLSAIVTEQHRSAAVFEQFHLNYCCKGKQSLEEACKENNVPLNKVMEALKEVYAIKKSELRFDTLSLSNLADYIVYTHHSFLKKEMNDMVIRLEKVIANHGKKQEDLGEILVLFTTLCNLLKEEIQLEERFLFPQTKLLEQYLYQPASLNHECGSYLRSAMYELEIIHSNAEKITTELNHFTNGYRHPPNICVKLKLLYASLKAFEQDMNQHFHLENNILFPKLLLLKKEVQISWYL